MTQEINKRLIVFTGPDGIGKTTQAKLLVEWINTEEFKYLGYKDVFDYFDAEYIKELNDSDYIFSAFRELVYSLYNSNVNVVLLANLIKLNRYVLQDQITTQLRTYFNDIVIVDRWNICTYCYLIASDVDKVFASCYLTDEHTIIPGLTIMLVGMNGANRMSNRESNNNMFEDIGNDFNTKLAQTYIDFDTSLYVGKVIKVNNDNLTKDETHELIKEAVLNYLRGL